VAALDVLLRLIRDLPGSLDYFTSACGLIPCQRATIRRPPHEARLTDDRTVAQLSAVTQLLSYLDSASARRRVVCAASLSDLSSCAWTAARSRSASRNFCVAVAASDSN